MSKRKRPDNEEYDQAAARLAFRFAPTIYACKKCGWPVARGYICQTCGDHNPSDPPEVKSDATKHG